MASRRAPAGVGAGHADTAGVGRSRRPPVTLTFRGRRSEPAPPIGQWRVTVKDLVSVAVDESPAYSSIVPGSTTNVPALS